MKQWRARRFIAIFAVVLLCLSTITASGAADMNGNTSLDFDVVFVIDGSGSMAYADPNRLASEASKLFIDMCESQSSRAGYVLYSHKLLASNPLMAMADVAQKKNIKASLSAIDYKKNQDTDIALGLTEAGRILQNGASLESGRNPLIILLSDGNTDLPKGPRTVEQSNAELAGTLTGLADKGIPVYTIGLNFDGKLDVGQMKAIAEQTRGKSYETTDADQLPAILSAIFADHIKSRTVELGSFVGDGKTQTATIPIPDNSVYEANIIILSAKEVKDLVLRAPGGMQVVMSEDNGIHLSRSRFYTLVKLINPARGDWQLDFTGATGDKITINLLSAYDLALELTVEQELVVKDSPATFYAALTGAGGKVEDAQLFDDATAQLFVTDQATGETVTVDMVSDGTTMKADYQFGAVGKYGIRAVLTGKDGAFTKESEQKIISIQPAEMALKNKKGISLWAFGSPFSPRKEVLLSSFIKYDATSVLDVVATTSDWTKRATLFYREEDQIVEIKSLVNGKTSIPLRISDQYGQSVELQVSINTISGWLLLLFLALLITAAALAVLVIRHKKKPRFKGESVKLELELPAANAGDTPAAATMIFPSAIKANLMHLLSNSTYIRDYQNAINHLALGNVFSGIEFIARKNEKTYLVVINLVPGRNLQADGTVITKKKEIILAPEGKTVIVCSAPMSENEDCITITLSNETEGGIADRFGGGDSPFGGGSFGGDNTDDSPFGGFKGF